MYKRKKFKVIKIYPGIFMIKLPLPEVKPDHLNVYFFCGDTKTGGTNTLLDTGMKQTGPVLEAALASIGFTLGDLDQIVVSHGHYDHYGAAAWIRKRSGKNIPVIAHPDEAERLAAANGLGITLPFLYPYLKITGLPFHLRMAVIYTALLFKSYTDGIQPDILASDGDDIMVGSYKATILSASGHSRGSLCIWLENEKLLFSADLLLAYLPHTDPYLMHLKGGKERCNQADYYKSIGRMEALSPDYVFPGHGDILSDLPVIISNYHKEYLKKDAKILKAIKKQERTVYEIAKKLFPKALKTGNGFPIYIVVSEIYSHLQLLVQNGYVDAFRKKKVIFYRAVEFETLYDRYQAANRYQTAKNYDWKSL